MRATVSGKRVRIKKTTAAPAHPASRPAGARAEPGARMEGRSELHLAGRSHDWPRT